MKHFFYFLLSIFSLSASHAYAQKRMVENAIKEVTLVPAKGDTTNSKRPCAVLNKSLRTITVRIEELVEVDNYLQKRTMVFRNLGPHERRYVGTAGCDHMLMHETCRAYKVILSYFEDAPPKVMVSTKAAAPPAETESGAAAAASAK